MAETKTDTKAERSAPAGGDLAPAAGSSDPAVHQLLAERQTAQMNGDKDAEKASTAALAELGYQ